MSLTEGRGSWILGVKQGLRTVCRGRGLALFLQHQLGGWCGSGVCVSGVLKSGRPGIKKRVCDKCPGLPRGQGVGTSQVRSPEMRAALRCGCP